METVCPQETLISSYASTTHQPTTTERKQNGGVGKEVGRSKSPKSITHLGTSSLVLFNNYYSDDEI
jgi:hypothetical protein